MKMTGVRQLVSWKTSSSVHAAGSVNSAPSFRPTYALQAKISFSSRNTRITHSLANDAAGSFSSQPAGSGSACGSADDAQASHSEAEADTEAERPSSAATVASAYCSAFQEFSLTQGGRCGAVAATLPPPPMGPRTRKLHSGALISPLEEWRRMEVQTCEEQGGVGWRAGAMMPNQAG